MSVKSHQVFIAQNGTAFGVITLDILPEATTLSRADWRYYPPFTKSICDSPEVGKENFESAMKTTIKNGWKILYLGERNMG